MFFSFKTRIITSNPPTSFQPKANKSWGVCGSQKNWIGKGQIPSRETKSLIIQGVPLTAEPGISLIILPLMRILPIPVAARLLRLWVRIPPGAWMFACCECYVLSGRGLCDELITRLEESYRLWCVVVCDLETSRTSKPWPASGRSTTKKTNQDIATKFGADLPHCVRNVNENDVLLFKFRCNIFIASISRPTDATCDRFYFLSICVLYMFRASSAHHQESLNCIYSL
jgi:hypothetical protein